MRYNGCIFGYTRCMGKPSTVQFTQGQQIGEWTVITPNLRDIRGKQCHLVRCSCGNERIVIHGSLRNGLSTSCGCRMPEKVKARKVTHGLAGTDNYQRWHRIIARCYNPATLQYKDWGGRGIEVCEQWRNDVVAFCQWIDENLGPCPDGWSLDRIDNDGNYEPGNLRWASRSTQAKNRRPFKRGAPMTMRGSA
jgi:hypothetical protein